MAPDSTGWSVSAFETHKYNPYKPAACTNSVSASTPAGVHSNGKLNRHAISQGRANVGISNADSIICSASDADSSACFVGCRSLKRQSTDHVASPDGLRSCQVSTKFALSQLSAENTTTSGLPNSCVIAAAAFTCGKSRP